MKDDSDNLDGDLQTDKWIQVGWSSLTDLSWPGDGETLPLLLINFQFTPLSTGATSVNAYVNETSGVYVGETNNASISITCPTATIDSFSADNTGLCSGQSATLSWATT
ncbi:MAG: hypothetical protein GXP53_01780, partial [Deltaproteobacteria bacterium]|nr:hypothetical protein [Deltaproteobacteria bacterium]